MDPTLAAALVGAFATIMAAVIPVAIKQIRKERGILHGSIDQLVVPLSKSNAREKFKSVLPKAKSVRVSGWAIVRTIDENRRQLRELIQRGGELRILMLDPASRTIAILDEIITATDPLERKSRNWAAPERTAITKTDLMRTIEILTANGITKNNGSGSSTLHLCDSLLSYGLLMVECDDGSGWAAVQIYSAHPDFPIAKRLGFTLGNNKSELWQALKEQFDAAWEDPYFSHPHKV